MARKYSTSSPSNLKMHLLGIALKAIMILNLVNSEVSSMFIIQITNFDTLL